MTRSFEYAQKQNRNRSQFWLKIHENDDATTILANEMTKRAISIRYPSIVQSSARRGWKLSDKGSYYSLWIPDNLMSWDTYEELKGWAEIAGKQCIWLSTNQNTKPFFTGTELDFCVAYDWNFLDHKNGIMTPTGKAENQMKWNPGADNNQYWDVLKTAMKSCLDCLPYDCHANNFVVTAIPADALGQTKVAWKLAGYAAQVLNVPMIPLTLVNEKPSMKNLPIDQKVNVWQSVLSNPYWFSASDELRRSLYNRNVLIIDDLYQSGASIWYLAQYLKDNMNVRVVQGATAVKAMRDSDNL